MAHSPLAPDTPMKTTASCFGSESTADAMKIQKFIPHVENTAVVTASAHGER